MEHPGESERGSSGMEFDADEVTSGTLRRYLRLLQQELELPFEVMGINGSGTTTYILHKLDYEIGETVHGLLGIVTDSRNRIHHFPLADLEAIDQTSENFSLLDTYSEWFVSNR